MAGEQGSTDWGCTFLGLLIFAAGIWWWDSRDTAPPPVITPLALSQPQPNAAAAPTPPTPTHNYDFVEGDVYGYIAAVSEEERKTGKVAGDVVMFRYAGFWNDEFHLERIGDAGDILGVSTCPKPCVAIKSYYGGSMARVAYNPASIIGSAIEDAMTGQLRRKQSKPVARKPAEADDSSPATETAEGADAEVNMALDYGQPVGAGTNE